MGSNRNRNRKGRQKLFSLPITEWILGNRWWTIKFTKLNNEYGACDYDKRAISIDGRISRKRIFLTLIHELTHATISQLNENVVVRIADPQGGECSVEQAMFIMEQRYGEDWMDWRNK